MWNKISCKSQYKEYLQKRQDDNLCKILTSVKAQIDTSRPKTMKKKTRKTLDHIKTTNTARNVQINEENKSLLQRMLRIDLNPIPPLEKKIPETVSLKSLNNASRRKKLEEIQSSNKRLFRRLQSTNSVYSAAQ